LSMRHIWRPSVGRCCGIGLIVCLLTAVGRSQAVVFPLSAPVLGAHPSLSPLGPTHGVADLNLDGREDVVAGFGNSVASIQTIAGGGYGPPSAIATWSGVQSGWVHAVGDLTGDGFADVLCAFVFFATGNSASFLYPGNGSGQFGGPVTLPDQSGFVGTIHDCFIASIPSVTPPGGPPAVILCSRRTTPVMEIAVHVLVYQAGNFAVVSVFTVPAPLPLGPGAFFRFRRAGDVNGDGLCDLIGTGASPPFIQSDWVVLPGIASPPYFSGPIVVSAQFPLLADFEVADVNNDGATDVVARRPGGLLGSGLQAIDIATYVGNSTAPLATVHVSVTGVASHNYNVVEDVDGDGARDLVLSLVPPLTGPTVWGLAFSRGDGLGNFGSALVLQSSPAISSPACVAADANGDGLRDIVGYAAIPNTFVLYNESSLGTGVPGAGGTIPQQTVGIAIPGNPFYYVGVVGGAANAPAFLGISLGVLPSPDPWGVLVDPTMMILPVGAIGIFSTDQAGQASWALSLPPAPILSTQQIYIQWGIVDPSATAGYSLSPARKVLFW
jgi:hypothetical protein